MRMIQLAANTSFTRIEEWYSRSINYKESEGRWLNMFELQVRPQHASTQNNCNCPLPIYQHGRACSRRITTSCNENKIGVHLAPIKLSGEENKSTPSKPTAFSSWFCWVIKAATLTTGKDDGHSGFGAPCHRCVVFVDSRHEKVQRLREKIYDMFIFICTYHVHPKTPKKKTLTLKYVTKTKQSWTWITCNPCFFVKSQMPHGHSSKLPQSKNAIKTWRLQYFDLTWTCL